MTVKRDRVKGKMRHGRNVEMGSEKSFVRSSDSALRKKSWNAGLTVTFPNMRLYQRIFSRFFEWHFAKNHSLFNSISLTFYIVLQFILSRIDWRFSMWCRHPTGSPIVHQKSAALLEMRCSFNLAMFFWSYGIFVVRNVKLIIFALYANA